MSNMRESYLRKKKIRKKKVQPFSIDQQLPCLRKLNQQGQLVMFLGAGISASCSLPDWNSLLDNLNDRLKEKGVVVEGDEDVADLARAHFGSDFNRLVSDALYGGGVSISQSIRSVAMSGVGKIICFNFDDLLEETLQAECVPHKVILNGDEFNLNKKSLHVFHPHGYLGRFDTEDEYKNSRVILSRSDYDSLYEDHYCLTNLIQLSTLITRSVVFVGMSMTDPNTERLLRKSRSLGVRHWHYALLKKCHKTFKEDTARLRGLGVDPVWFDDYSDIPKIMASIRK